MSGKAPIPRLDTAGRVAQRERLFVEEPEFHS